MENLKTFWTWAYILGIGAFYVLVLAIIPLGFLDLLQMLRRLSKQDEQNHQGNDAW